MSGHDDLAEPDGSWSPRHSRRLEHLAELALDLPIDVDTPPADELAMVIWLALRASRTAADPAAAYVRALPMSPYHRAREVEADLQRLEEADEDERTTIRQNLIIHFLPLAAQRAGRLHDGTVPLAQLIQAGNRAIIESIQRMPPVPTGTTPLRLRMAARVWGAVTREAEGAASTGPDPFPPPPAPGPPR